MLTPLGKTTLSSMLTRYAWPTEMFLKFSISRGELQFTASYPSLPKFDYFRLQALSLLPDDLPTAALPVSSPVKGSTLSCSDKFL